MDNPDVARPPTDAAVAINAGSTLAGALDTVACLASTVVPDINDVDVLLTGRRGRIRGEGATGALARDLERLQIVQVQGPGLRAVQQSSATVSIAVGCSERSCR